MVEFLGITFLTERKFKDAQDAEMTRLYEFKVPYGVPYAEIKEVIAEFSDRITVLEEQSLKKETEEAAPAQDVTAEVVN